MRNPILNAQMRTPRSGRQFRITTNRIRTDHEVPLNICLVGLLPPFYGDCGVECGITGSASSLLSLLDSVE
jgi:hypothetical protein